MAEPIGSTTMPAASVDELPLDRAAEIRLLILEDVATDAELMEAELRRAQLRFTSLRVADRESFQTAVSTFCPDLILADYLLPQFSAPEALGFLRQRDLCIPFILVTGTQSEEIAVVCMRAGADDYILKGSLKRLPASVLQALRQREIQREKKRAEDQLRQTNLDLARREQDLRRTLRSLEKSHHELRQTQLQLIQSAKMESVGCLAAGVAHEVKNPLTTLLMGVEYLERHLGTDDPELVSVLRDMDDAVKRANRVILGLLDFSAPGDLALEELQLNEAIDAALGFVRLECTKRRATIVRDLALDLPVLRLDRNKIEQVFVNLFLNAIQAMPDGGTLRVHTEIGLPEDRATAQVCGTIPPDEILVIATVEDTGTGISPQHIHKIFDPFFTTRKTGQATGLGLAVVKKIVELHGGHLGVRNLPESGAQVVLAFTVQEAT